MPTFFAIAGRIQWQIHFQQQVQLLKLITSVLKQLPGFAYKCTVTQLQAVQLGKDLPASTARLQQSSIQKCLLAFPSFLLMAERLQEDPARLFGIQSRCTE